MVQPSRAYSSKDLPGQLKLKRRREGQLVPDQQDTADFADDLVRRELKRDQPLAIEEEFKEPMPKRQRTDIDPTGQVKIEQPENPFAEQDKDWVDEPSDDDGEESGEAEDEEDSDELELMREYAKVKAEREAERRKQDEERAELIRKQEAEAALGKNPLMASSLGSEVQSVVDESYALRKRWFEETVFKNQARGTDQKKKRFINDTVRSDFHRRFMAKYIQ